VKWAPHILESTFFWLLATVQVVLSFAVWLRGRSSSMRSASADRATLIARQDKDTWLACGVIWTVLLSDDISIKAWLYMLGTVVLVWLLWRALQCFRLL
jgi:hypothetical protein